MCAGSVEGRAADAPIAAVVNGVPITMAAVDRAVNDKVPRISGHGTISEGRRTVLRAEVLEELIEEELIVQDAKRRGLSVAASAIDEEVAKVKARFPDGGTYLKALARQGLSEAEVRRGIEQYLLAKKAVDREVTAKIDITEDTMRKYYDADPSRFVVPDQVRLRQILITVDPGGSAVEWKAAQARAGELAVQARKGAAFADLAKAHSQHEPSRDQGGDLGWVHRGQLEHDQEAVVFALEAGGISEPVRTLYGFAVFQVEAKKPRRALAYEEVNKTRLADELRRAETDRVRTAWLADLRQRAKVEIRPSEP
ncbi:MAG: peptidylprolyl isomerase [Nitrospirae bacterium]|nr:peptidylprolyl isomerase [Nitrospirota bacterium]